MADPQNPNHVVVGGGGGITAAAEQDHFSGYCTVICTAVFAGALIAGGVLMVRLFHDAGSHHHSHVAVVAMEIVLIVLAVFFFLYACFCCGLAVDFGVHGNPLFSDHDRVAVPRVVVVQPVLDAV
uniref:Uncharacterized protein n=1 Tax=Leersia perrieri TaxID=77586 RepID=A0A0D9VAM6_9ORYZ